MPISRIHHVRKLCNVHSSININRQMSNNNHLVDTVVESLLYLSLVLLKRIYHDLNVDEVVADYWSYFDVDCCWKLHLYDIDVHILLHHV